MEYWSILKLRGILKFVMNFHSQLDMMLSALECLNSDIATRLVRKVALTEHVMVAGEFCYVFNSRGSSMGVRIIVRVWSMEMLRSSAVSIISYVYQVSCVCWCSQVFSLQGSTFFLILVSKLASSD